MSDDRVLAAIAGLGEQLSGLDAKVSGLDDRLSGLSEEFTRLRVETMARIDRLQHTVDVLREDSLVSYGRAETTERAVTNQGEMQRLLQEQFDRMYKRLLGIDERLRTVEERQESGMFGS